MTNPLNLLFKLFSNKITSLMGLFLFGILFSAFSQKTPIDQQIKTLNLPADNKKAFKVIDDTIYYLFENDFGKAKSFLPILYYYKQNINNPFYEAAWHKTKAYYYSLNNQPDSAVYFLKKGIENINKLENKTIEIIAIEAKLYNALAMIYHQSGLYNPSISAHFKAISLSESIFENEPKNSNNNKFLSWAYTDLAATYSYTPKSELTHRYFLKGIQFAKQNSSNYVHAINLFNYGVFLLDINMLDSAIHCFSTSLNFLKNGNSELEIIQINLNLAKIYLRKNNLVKAKELLNSTIQGSQRLKYHYLEYQSFLVLSNLYLKEKTLNKALKTAQMLDSLLKEFNYPNLLKETKLTLVDIYEEKGDYLQANFHLKEYVKIVDSIKADELESKVNNLNLKYLLEKTNVKFDELKIKTNTQKIKIEYQKRIIIIAIILGIAILIFSLIILNFFIRLKKTNTKLSETSKELNKKNEELIELNSIHNNLFAIISHDLRGPIGTSTTLLNILNENSTELSTEERNKLMKTIGISVGSTFNLIENLLYWSKNRMRNLKTEKYRVYPYTIADMVITGINNTIFTKDIKIQNDILKEIEILTCEDILKIIFRNLLTNAIKFTSRNGMIRIWSETESNILKIHFTDNGEGMTKSTLSTIFDSKIIKSTQGTESEGGSGLGLMITSELTEQIGGALTAKSILGQGSTFTVTLPIEH